MFNFKKIQDRNAQLQEQLTLVTGLLHQRQDELLVVREQLRQQPLLKLPTHFYTNLKDEVQSSVSYYTDNSIKDVVTRNIANKVAAYLDNILDPIFYPDSVGDEGEDED